MHHKILFPVVQVVITVLAEMDALSSVPAMSDQDDGAGDAEQSGLIFNLYCPKLSESIDVDLPHAMQKMMTGKVIFAVQSLNMMCVCNKQL